MAEVDIKELKDSFDEIKNLFESEFKAAVEKGDVERKKVGDQLGQTKEKLAKMEETFSKHDKLWDTYKAEKAAQEAKMKALEELLAEGLRPPASGEAKADEEIHESLKPYFSENKHWNKFLRKGEERLTPDEFKSLATDNAASGGFLMPYNQAQQVIELNVLSSPIRQIASVETISQGDNLEIPKEGSTAFSVGWTSERASRTETTAGTLGLEKIPVHECYANPFVTQKMIDDAAYDVDGYVVRKLGQQFGKLEATAFCTGTGLGQPEGIAATTNGVSVQVCTASGAFTGALLIDLQHLLEEPYASNATWVSKRVNFGKIRQLAGNEGYLWQPGIAADKGPTLLGRPYVAANDVATIVSASAGDRVIYFGDFMAGYKIVDRVGISLVRDPFTNKPHIEFYTTKRVGGQVVLPEAIKIGTVNS